LALALLLVATVLNLLKPWPLKFVVDTILPAPQGGIHFPWGQTTWSFPSALAITCITLVGIHLMWGAVNLAQTYTLIGVGLQALLRVRTELYAYLQFLPLRFHDGRRSSDSCFRVAYDAQAVQTYFNRGFVTILGSLLTLVGTFFVMWKMSPLLALLSLAVVPFLMMAIVRYAGRIRKETAALQAQESDVLARASEGLSSIRVVHAFGRESHEIDLFRQECRHALEANLRLSMTNVASTFVVGTFLAVGMAALLWAGAGEVMAGRMTLGDLLVF
jgi:ATP-binding cassette subfamily B protein/subfamily B ATP-binding cassette protein MsbA